jgi:hypothetical protein
MKDCLNLPPLRKPRYAQQASEALRGWLLVTVLIAFFVGVFHISVPLAVDNIDFPEEVGQGFLIVIWVEAVVALMCLIGLYMKNPGIVRRSPSTCNPIPEEVAKRLSEGISLEDLGNTWDGQKSFCMRCLVWRDPSTNPVAEEGCKAEMHEIFSNVHCGLGSRAHHCSVCERCVLNFDHHCQVFGICIAGQGCSGNIGFFHCLISLGLAATATLMTFALMCVILSFHEDGEVIWVAIFGGLWCFIICCILRRPIYELACCRGVDFPCKSRARSTSAKASSNISPASKSEPPASKVGQPELGETVATVDEPIDLAI